MKSAPRKVRWLKCDSRLCRMCPSLEGVAMRTPRIAVVVLVVAGPGVEWRRALRLVTGWRRSVRVFGI
jgi:hypothetical protein